MHVFALIGPSGTGKSHHALFVAREHHIDMIIDDGLLIEGSKILAGHSAKRSSTRVGAIKTALFTDDYHALEVKNQIREQCPESILILGTSMGMVEKITEKLELPCPKTIINIDDVSSPRQINKAMQIRNSLGTHVVPAPTVEVKPKFSGSIITPLRSIFRKKAEPNRPLSAKHLWVEQTVVRPSFNSLGRFYIANEVISEIAKYSCRSIPGISRIGKVHVNSSDKGITLHVDAYLIYGYFIPDVLTEAQHRIKESIELMTSLHIITVDVHGIELVLK